MAKSKYFAIVAPRLLEVERWAKDGVSDEDIAGNLGIAYSTLRCYREKYDEFADALTHGKEVSNEIVEGSLYKRCNGYNAQIKKVFKVRRVEYDPDTGKKLREYDELQEGIEEVHVPADTTAMMFWLANRCKERWKYKPDEKDEPEKDGSGVIEIPFVEVAADG